MAPSPKKRFINRELSWLEFNQRVLEEARDAAVPLLERLKFLAITSSNLDEFFMVRVSGLQTLVAQGVTKADPSGMTPARQLDEIRRRAHRMVEDQYVCFLQELEPLLKAAGIVRIEADELSESQSRTLVDAFEQEIFSILTPMAVSEDDEFPMLANRMVHLCVRLKGDDALGGQERFAVIPLGQRPDRFVAVGSDDAFEYMMLEDVVALFIKLFFPGRHVMECVPFRITRAADMSVQEDLASDLLSQMEGVLDARKRSPCVRLEVAERATQKMLSFLQRALGVDDENIYSLEGPLDLSAFMPLADIDMGDSLKYESWVPQLSPQLDPAVPVHETLRQTDVLLLHPFESFEPVVRLLNEAADDPDVLAIKQTLYRTSRRSPVVAALMKAAENGKYVTVIVELKARFDEARNIEWARALEEAGVQVIYGVKGFKTHAKVLIIVRREASGIQRYVHFGTGNYNEATSRQYTDISYMTRNADLAADATSFFNAITGYSQPQDLRKLEAAPMGLRDRVLELIAGEAERKRQGQRARIMAKMNSLVDPLIINALYDASKAGVKIRLNVRGICCLRPGVAKLSENIRVVSIVDRFLEHSRVFCFHHGGDDRVFISSADWMPRNLDRRIELLVPVEDPIARDRLVAMLETCFKDNLKARILRGDGTHRRARPPSRQKRLRSQEALFQQAVKAAQQAEQTKQTVFEPHRPAGTREAV